MKIKKYRFYEKRGEGRGVKKVRQQDGGTDTCFCPECNYEEVHERGIPCVEKICPKCGIPLQGK